MRLNVADAIVCSLSRYRQEIQRLESEVDRQKQLLDASNASNSSLSRRVAEAESRSRSLQHEVDGLSAKLAAVNGTFDCYQLADSWFYPDNVNDALGPIVAAEIEQEKSERDHWARARLDLISQVDDEEAKLQRIIDSTPVADASADDSSKRASGPADSSYRFSTFHASTASRAMEEADSNPDYRYPYDVHVHADASAPSITPRRSAKPSSAGSGRKSARSSSARGTGSARRKTASSKLSGPRRR